MKIPSLSTVLPVSGMLQNMTNSVLNRVFVSKQTVEGKNITYPSPVMLVGGSVLLVGGFVYWHYRVSSLTKRKEELENEITKLSEDLKNDYLTEMYHQTVGELNATIAELNAAKKAFAESTREVASLEQEIEQAANNTKKESRDQATMTSVCAKQYQQEAVLIQEERRKKRQRV